MKPHLAAQWATVACSRDKSPMVFQKQFNDEIRGLDSLHHPGLNQTPRSIEARRLARETQCPFVLTLIFVPGRDRSVSRLLSPHGAYSMGPRGAEEVQRGGW